MFETMDTGLLVTLTAVFVAGLAAVLGIWMERDERKPPRYAYALSALIVLATLVSLMQSFLDKGEQDQIKEDMARLLTTMDKLASETENPELLELVKSEMSAQSRANPEVVQKVAQRVSDEGRDPTEVLGKHLDAAEMEKVARKGTVKPRNTEKTAGGEAEKPTEKTTVAQTKRETKEGASAPAAPAPPPDPAAIRAALMQGARAGTGPRGLPVVPPGATAGPAQPAGAAPGETAPAGAKPGLEAAAAPTPTPTAGVLPPRPGAGRVRPAGAAPRPPKGKKPTAPRRPKAP